MKPIYYSASESWPQDWWPVHHVQTPVAWPTPTPCREGGQHPTHFRAGWILEELLATPLSSVRIRTASCVGYVPWSAEGSQPLNAQIMKLLLSLSPRPIHGEGFSEGWALLSGCPHSTRPPQLQSPLLNYAAIQITVFTAPFFFFFLFSSLSLRSTESTYN